MNKIIKEQVNGGNDRERNKMKKIKEKLYTEIKMENGKKKESTKEM